MIVGVLVIAGAAVCAGVAAVFGPGHAVEIAKEFGGGFAAYWTHHLFHKAWAVSGRAISKRGR